MQGKLWLLKREIGYGLEKYGRIYYDNNKVNQSHYRPEVPRGFQEVKVPRLRDNGPGWW